MLSQTAEHALRALLYLGGEAAGRAASAEEIAGAIGAPRNYLAKTLNILARGGLVSATRGPGGGFRLQVEPAALAVGQVIDEIDPPTPQGMCMLGGRPCDEANPCSAHDRWVAMWEASKAPLRRTTLADLLARNAGETAGPPAPDSSYSPTER